MPLAYVLDEHLRGPLWSAIQRHNARGANLIDAVRVGDADGPPLGATDAEIVRWAEKSGRIIVTFDERTMPGHFAEFLRSGSHSPGLFMIRPGQHLLEIVEFLALAALASEPQEWVDQVVYLP